jgi:uncharacterized protein
MNDSQTPDPSKNPHPNSNPEAFPAQPPPTSPGSSTPEPMQVPISHQALEPAPSPIDAADVNRPNPVHSVSPSSVQANPISDPPPYVPPPPSGQAPYTALGSGSGYSGGAGGGNGGGAPHQAPFEGNEARTWSVACHLSALLMYLSGVGHILGPLVVWLLKRHEYPAVEHHGKEALNFQLSFTLYVIVLIPLVFLTCGWAATLYPVLLVGQLIFMVVAAIKASAGETYEYPLSIRFIK